MMKEALCRWTLRSEVEMLLGGVGAKVENSLHD